MARDNDSDPEKALIEAMHQPAASGIRLRPRDIEQLQDIIIRAHYLSMELRDICAASGVAPRDMSLAASHMLKSWALAFAGGLERATNPPDSP